MKGRPPGSAGAPSCEGLANGPSPRGTQDARRCRRLLRGSCRWALRLGADDSCRLRGLVRSEPHQVTGDLGPEVVFLDEVPEARGKRHLGLFVVMTQTGPDKVAFVGKSLRDRPRLGSAPALGSHQRLPHLADALLFDDVM